MIRSLEYGGAEKSLVNLLRELPEEKYQIDLLLFKKKGDFISQLPAYIHLLETPQSLRRLFGPLGQAGRYVVPKLVGTALGKMLRKTRKERMAYRWQHFYKKAIPMLPGEYDTAVAYVGTEVLYYVADCVQAKKKFVWIHNDYRKASYSKQDDAPYFAEIDGIVSVSQDCVGVLKEEFPEYSEKIHCIENITSSAVVREMAEEFVPEEYFSDRINILSVGRLSVQKGFDMAIQACAELKKHGLNFCWFVIGDGDQKQKLEDMIQQYDVADAFRLLGTRNNPYPYIRHCGFLAQPSRFEGKSVVLDEAKILGTPILATAYSTVADQIQDNLEGVITEMSPSGIVDSVIKLTEHPELLETIKQYLAAREYGNQREVIKYMTLLDA